MKKTTTLALTGFVIGSLGLCAYEFLFPKDHGLRAPATATKLTSRWQGKHQRLLDVKILAVGGIPDTDDKDLTLKVQIQGLEPISGEVHYRWILPPEASRVAGELEDSVPSLPDPSKFLQREITIQGASLEGPPKVIVVQAYTEIGGEQIGNAGVFSTNPSATQISAPEISNKSIGQGPTSKIQQ